MTKTWPFDTEFTQNYTRVRQAFISEFLDAIAGSVSLQSAIDVGCGVGYFSKYLSERGFQVVAVDGRDENVKEGQRRNPKITFYVRDVEDPTLPALGVFDLALCVGLLYHLENPFRAIRNLQALTGKVLIIESMCAPGPEPGLLMLDEGQEDDQGLNFIALYPTESCLVKMLYRAGFPFVYRFDRLPRDPQFTTTVSRKRSRTFLAASRIELSVPNLRLAKEPIRWSAGSSDPWTTVFAKVRGASGREVASLKALLTRIFRPSRRMAVSGPPGGDSSSK